MPARPAIVLDCDPGHDDAMAMVVAARHTQLLGITTVAGNATIERTTRNALVMRDLLGLDVPVHRGASRPLIAEPHDAPDVHGASGLDGADLPEPRRGVDSEDAVGFLIETCRRTEGVWLVPIGPLTNIAHALRLAPDLAGRMAGVSLMGGGTFGNRSATAEFNLWADPEAAWIVFNAGVRLQMCGLDVTHGFQATPPRIASIDAIPGRLADLLADLLRFFSGTYIARHHHVTGAPVHDPLAVIALTHPELLQRVERHVDIELQGALTRGMTVIDQRDLRSVPPANCTVFTAVDADAAFEVLRESIEWFSAGPGAQGR